MTNNVVEFPNQFTPEEQKLIAGALEIQRFTVTMSAHLTVMETMRLQHGINSRQFEKAYLDMIETCKGASHDQ